VRRNSPVPIVPEDGDALRAAAHNQ
jgi:hypothetical protein